VVACAFAAGWIRSRANQDAVIVQLRRGNHVDSHIFMSMLGTLTWSHSSPWNTDKPKLWEYRHSKHPTPFVDEWKGAEMHSRWKWNGFEFTSVSYKETQWMGQAKAWTRKVEVWDIPYLFVVIPLTLLSAWLLLSKPRAGEESKPRASSLTIVPF
jgi:hypothetical protein